MDFYFLKISEKAIGSFLKQRNDYIDNYSLLDVCRKNADKIWRENFGAEKLYENEDKADFFFIYCYYTIEALGKQEKYQKMRALFDMARTLMAAWVILFVISGCKLGYLFITYASCEQKVCTLIKMIAFAVLFFLAYYRANYIMKYKIQMLMGLYNACISRSKEVS